MSTAYLSLGGNLGDRRRYLADAVLALNRAVGVRVEALSAVFETEPVGVVDQPMFYNLAVEVATTLAPRELLGCCLAIESGLGRVRRECWGPRTIDLDLLWQDGLSVDEPDLTLPHPRLRERAFVVVPLAEIAPRLVVGGVPLARLAAEIDATGLRRLGQLDTLAP